MLKYAIAGALGLATSLQAQHTHGHDPDSSRMLGAADASMSATLSANAAKHLDLSPARSATKSDSTRALAIVKQLRTVLSKYADTSAAVADGFRMFAPGVKQQRVYHFTNYGNAFRAAFRFDPAQPTSILYQRGPNGRLQLVGAMYTAPKRLGTDALDERVPLSIARWHKHVNWCIPPLRKKERWLEQKDGQPVFGPESPIATRAECRAAGGRFLASPMGWMVHVNAFAGDSLGAVFEHHH